MTFLSEIVEGRRELRKIPGLVFEKEYDVIVCGLGTAGALAALFCAENGLSVLGIETFTTVGGTHTVGGVVGHYFGCPGGHYEVLEEQVMDFAQRYTSTFPESRKLVTERALHQQGAEILYEASACGVYLEANRVIGLRVVQDGTLRNYGAKIVMDCTAEAYVATMAGCETEVGRASDGQTQPYSLVSMIHNGERYRYTNVDFGRVDQFDPVALSQAILFSRGYKMGEGHTGVTQIAQMPLLGIREGRRIVSEEQVCLEDLFADKQTKTPIYYSYADLDKHGWDIAFDGETLGDWAIGANLGAYNVTIAVPYKALLPKDYEGILVPCRGLGVDRDIASCVRMNLDMKKLAEGAAQWATLAITQNLDLREVPYDQLRERLEASGCLKEEDNRGYRVDGKVDWDKTPINRRDVHWISDPELLEQGLSTEKPGEAIWSARRIGEKALPVLKNLLDAEVENTRKHAAFALALLGCNDGLDVLREMVVSRDGLMLKDCRKHNNFRGCMAIYWLGRLEDAEITPALMELICDEKENCRELYHQGQLLTTRYEVSDFNNIYFQFMSQAVMALVRIGDAHENLRAQIGKAFTEAFADEAYYSRITTRPQESSEGNMALTIKKIAFSAIENWEK